MSLISGREAARILAVHGLSLSSCQHLLATGVAGKPCPVGGADLYDEAAVRELAERPAFDSDELPMLFPEGLLMIRLPRGQAFDSSANDAVRRAALAGPWRLGHQQTWVHWCAWREGGLQMALLASGFVLAGATVLDSTQLGDLTRLETARPGPWLERIRAHRIVGIGHGQPATLVRPTAPSRPLRTEFALRGLSRGG